MIQAESAQNSLETNQLKTYSEKVVMEPEVVRVIKPKKTCAKKVPILTPPINTTQETIMEVINEETHLKHLRNYIESNQMTMDEEIGSVLGHLGDYIEEPFTILESYFRNQPYDRLVRHQIESYNHFINYQIIRTIQMFNPVVIHSENDFVPELNQYLLEIFISFEDLKIHPPEIYENNGAKKLMLPQEARLRNFTYSSIMTVDLNIQYVIRNTENMDSPTIINKKMPKTNIGKIPIMVKSSICLLNQHRYISAQHTGECKLETGGYFIVKGSEKTVLGQERAAENRIYCFEGKNTPKWSWYAEIKSVPDTKCISPKQVEMLVSSKNNGFGYGIFIAIPHIKQPFELFVLFRALGIVTDKSICEHILLDINSERNKEMLKFLQASIIDSNKYMTQEDAIKYIVSCITYTPNYLDKEKGAIKKREFALDAINQDLFPHCKSLKQKMVLLGYMANKLIQTAFGWIPPDDRDSYVNKRIELTGTLLNNLFRNYFNKLIKEMQKHVIREIKTGSWRSTEDYENIINKTNLYKILKSTTLETGITRALSTGDFSIKQANTTKVGVAQVLNRLVYMATVSHLRRINTPLEKSGELIAPRKLHSTTWGFLCPAETPEGQSIGVVKNISYMAHITIPTNSASLYEYVQPYIEKIEVIEDLGSIVDRVKVFVNGSWIGVAKDPTELFTEMKQKKYKGIINIYTSIVFDYKKAEIRICSDGGRLTRPLLRVRNGSALITTEIIEKIKNREIGWNDLLTSLKLEESVIEYIDPEEQNYSLIAMKTKENYLNNYNNKHYSHCEIHPSTIFGVLASCTPFPDHNQAPRNTYQTAMAKQAIGIFATNHKERMDKTSYVLTYPSRPLVENRLMGFLHLEKIPAGCQIHVAIMTHTGYNQEDSVLVNKASIDRGLFNASIYHTEKDEDKNIIRDEIIRCKPDPTKTKGIKFGNYGKLNNQGFVEENTLIEDGDIIISKVLPIKENRNDPTKIIKFEDQSHSYSTAEECYVDKNYTSRNGDGYNFAKVRVRTFRKPVLGDKFSSRHGQKGTCGNIIPECDMPFTKNGLRPDIIINPHAIPSRMTIGQLKETLLGKVLLELGLFGDGTSFGNLDVKTICEELQKVNYESYGNEVMYNGLTGEQIEMSVFIGPVFYQRLKHMVNDKVHSRSSGPMVQLTHQAAEGRSKGGGLRVGEMERDVLISHGMSKFTRERLFEVSDKYSMHICKKCGMIAQYNDGTKNNKFFVKNDFVVYECRNCDNKTDFAYIETPYAYKLLQQELQTVNVAMRYITE